MYPILRIESVSRGVLFVNGQFCGPLEAEGQAFPAGRDAEIYVQLFPYSPDVRPLTVAMTLEAGQITRLEPQEHGYALIWPDSIIQLELRPVLGEGAQPEAPCQSETAPCSALLRYLTLRLAGDEAGAGRLLMRPQDQPDLPAYDAVVPLRFAPLAAGDRFDERAGLVRRLAPNVAAVDAALAVTSPAGQGHRLIERIDVMRT